MASNTTKDELELMMMREEVLCDELRPYVRGGMVHHPLVFAPYDPQHCAVVNAQYRNNVAATAEARAQGDWDRYVFLHHRPYRFWALTDALSHGLPMQTRADLIREVWLTSENIRQLQKDWQRVWQTLDDPQLTMNAAEQAALANLPAQFAIYRGIQNPRFNRRGMSWTTDRQRGIWFAYRNARAQDRPVLSRGIVKRAEVLAYFRERDESEIVVPYRRVTQVTDEKLPQRVRIK
jgi:hypothetical protein